MPLNPTIKLRKMKPIKPIIKKLWMATAMLCLSVSAFAYDFEVDGVSYNILSAISYTCEVSGQTDPLETSIVIPEKVSYRDREFRVIQIGKSAFENSHVEYITLPTNLNAIEEFAFAGSRLKEIELPKNLIHIKDKAFQGTKITSLILDFSQSCDIGRNAFSKCELLKDIRLGSNANLLKSNFNYDGDKTYGVFNENISLNKIEIDGRINIIPAYTFSGCPNIFEINILGTVNTIDGFAWTEVVKNINIDGYVNEFGNKPYGWEAALPCENLNITGTVEKCNGPYTSSLKMVRLNGEIHSLSGFENCNQIESIIIPNSVRSIDGNGFSGCTSLYELVLNDKITEVYDKWLKNCLSLKKLIIPSCVERITTGWPYQGVGGWGTGDLVQWNVTELIIKENPESNDLFAIGTKSAGCRLNWLCPKLERLVMEKDIFDCNAERFDDCINVLEDLNYLKEIEFGNITRRIIFGNLPSLEKIVIRGQAPPTFTSSFTNKQIMDVEIYVPYGYKEVYERSGWGIFWNIYELPKIEAESIDITNLSGKELEISVGDIYILNAIVFPENTTDKKISWASSDERVTTVSDEGLVTGISAGTATITASCGEVSATCEVTVTENDGIENIFMDLDSSISIYSPQGFLIKDKCNTDDLRELPKGIYIIVTANKRYKISI